jgi:hypothetical protein
MPNFPSKIFLRIILKHWKRRRVVLALSVCAIETCVLLHYIQKFTSQRDNSFHQITLCCTHPAKNTCFYCANTECWKNTSSLPMFLLFVEIFWRENKAYIGNINNKTRLSFWHHLKTYLHFNWAVLKLTTNPNRNLNPDLYWSQGFKYVHCLILLKVTSGGLLIIVCTSLEWWDDN